MFLVIADGIALEYISRTGFEVALLMAGGIVTCRHPFAQQQRIKSSIRITGKHGANHPLVVLVQTINIFVLLEKP